MTRYRTTQEPDQQPRSAQVRLDPVRASLCRRIWETRNEPTAILAISEGVSHRAGRGKITLLQVYFKKINEKNFPFLYKII